MSYIPSVWQKLGLKIASPLVKKSNLKLSPVQSYISQISKEGSWIMEQRFPVQLLCFNTLWVNPEYGSHLHCIISYSSLHVGTCKSASPSSKQGFVSSNKHIAAQQHFKKSFTLQENSEGCGYSSFCWLSSVSLCIFTFLWQRKYNAQNVWISL